eukprot:Awhi_evm1s15585
MSEAKATHVVTLKEGEEASESISSLYNPITLSKAIFEEVDSCITKWQDDTAESSSGNIGDIVAFADQGRRPSMEDKHMIIPDLSAMFGLK